MCSTNLPVNSILKLLICGRVDCIQTFHFSFLPPHSLLSQADYFCLSWRFLLGPTILPLVQVLLMPHLHMVALVNTMLQVFCCYVRLFARILEWVAPLGDLPNPGIKPMSPALAGRFLTTEIPGKPHGQWPQSTNPLHTLLWDVFLKYCLMTY